MYLFLCYENGIKKANFTKRNTTKRRFITDDLLMEGMVRDLVRVVQNYRKDAGFSVEDRIEISWDLDGQIANAVGKFDGYFRKETLTKHITEKISNPDFTGSLEMNKNTYKINLKKI
jgi:isoleucyl-tRNA synthetase